ncbi:hypothetical protein OUZ56_018363 [Daphnia magna]|uniref:Uncharacterized protein n=1 Tax=Daphnia magna TaxID=35525 RepID=A0ABQ9Z8L9_9CRUS|nr:hypothetical protein OUZ56_018363 [Daphnia magna]
MPDPACPADLVRLLGTTPTGPTQGRRSIGFGRASSDGPSSAKKCPVVASSATPSFRSASPVRPSAVPQQSPYNPTRRRNDVSQTMSSRRDWLTYHNTITYVPPMTSLSRIFPLVLD